MVDQAVAAQQDAVAGLHGEASDVRRHLIVDPEGHRDHVLPRVVPRVLGRELPSVDHLLNEGVVPRHLVDLSRIDDVRARVAGVGHMEGATIGDRKAEGRPHPFAFRMYLGLRDDGLIGEADGGSELVVVDRARDVGLAHQEWQERPGDALYRDPARDIPSTMSSHAVGHHQEQSGPCLGPECRPDLDRQDTVLVDGSDPPDVRSKPHLPMRSTNDRIPGPRARALGSDRPRQGHRPPCRRPPLNAIVM